MSNFLFPDPDLIMFIPSYRLDAFCARRTKIDICIGALNRPWLSNFVIPRPPLSAIRASPRSWFYALFAKTIGL